MPDLLDALVFICGRLKPMLSEAVSGSPLSCIFITVRGVENELKNYSLLTVLDVCIPEAYDL